MTMTTPRVPVARLCAFSADAFRAMGVPEAEAVKAAALLIDSDLAGSDGHGIFRLPQYIGRLRTGEVEPRAEIRVVEDAPATALVDGGNALGHLVMAKATELAIGKARSQGTAWIGVRGSNHAGAASIWVRQMLPHDMAGIYFAVGSNNFMAPWGGFERMLGTNPLAIAVPALEEPPVVLDMATSIAANGKVQMARQRGEAMPEGWMIDRTGKPVTDPKRAEEGVLLPVGDYKGYGLALMIGLLGGTLNNASFGRDDGRKGKASNTGQAIMAISLARLGDPTEIKRRVDGAIREMRGSGRLPGVEEIMVPGLRSHRMRLDREQNGVPVPPELKAALDKLAKDIGIAGL